MKTLFYSFVAASCFLATSQSHAESSAPESVCLRLALEVMKCTAHHGNGDHCEGRYRYEAAARDAAITLDPIDEGMSMGSWRDTKTVGGHVFTADVDVIKVITESGGTVYYARAVVESEDARPERTAAMIALGEDGSLTNGVMLGGPSLEMDDVSYDALLNIWPGCT